MKKKLLILLGVVALIGCKHEQYKPQKEEPTVASDVAIPLSTYNVGSKAGNRDNTTGFLVGDKIGVTAYFSKQLTPSMTTIPDEVDFETQPWFVNEAATADAPTGATDKENTFQWVKSVPMFFPQGKNIFLYAYYPYSDGSTVTEGVKFLGDASVSPAFGPEKLEVKLLDESITESDPAIKQPDVVVAKHDASVNRDTPVVAPDKLKLKFNHLLSQVQFYVKLAPSVVGVPTFQSLTFEVPGKANFAITAPDTYLDLSVDDTDKTIYLIDKPEVGEITVDEDGQGTKVLENPIMVFPYSKEDLAKCKMTLVVNFDQYGDQTFDVSLAGLTEGFVQGGKNDIVLKISRVEITLSATISPWVAGNEHEIPVE